ncbi:hypothetical protein GCM10029992_54960 [Glycomyces albus]
MTGAATVATYMEHPRALWEGAGPERAGMLFEAARAGGDVAELMRSGFEQLIDTLANDPEQSWRVRDTVEALMSDLDGDTPVCNAATVDAWLGSQTWEALRSASPSPPRPTRCPRVCSPAPVNASTPETSAARRPPT